MHRHWSQRLFAALIATWFVIVGLEPGALGACPMHGGVAPAAAEHAMHADHAMHGGHGAPGSPHAAHQCACPGTCCGVPVVTAPAMQSVVARVAEAIVVAHPIAREHLPAWTDYVLPFSTAPPARLG